MCHAREKDEGKPMENEDGQKITSGVELTPPPPPPNDDETTSRAQGLISIGPPPLRESYRFSKGKGLKKSPVPVGMALPGDSRFPPGAPARLPTPRCNRNDASIDDDAAACRDPATIKERRPKTAAFSKI